MRNFLTKRHENYWRERKVDWTAAYFTPEHPHRELIIKALQRVRFGSIIEIGCGAGANLYKISQVFPKVEIGGIDINAEAIETAKKLLPERTAVLEVSSATKLFLSDNSTDVLLSDMAYIYISPFSIGQAMLELKRVTRNNILFLEFYHPSWWKRQLLRLLTGYNAYNWPKLLTKYGFYNVELYKLNERDWPGGQPQKTFAWLISAKK